MLSRSSVSRMPGIGQQIGCFPPATVGRRWACQSSLLVVMLRLRWQSLLYVNVIHSHVGCTTVRVWIQGLPRKEHRYPESSVSLWSVCSCSKGPTLVLLSRVLWCMAVISHMREAAVRLSDWLCMGPYPCLCDKPLLTSCQLTDL